MWEFWCFDRIWADFWNETFFNVFDIDFDENIERRENFDEIIDRETISAQNIDFFDVDVARDVDFAIDVILTSFAFISLDVVIAIIVILTNFAFDVSNDVNINVDSLDDRNFVFCTMTTKMLTSSNLLSSRT